MIKNAKDLVFISVVLGLFGLSWRFIQNFPISEDAGYYAFMSKVVANGATPHVDFPISTNSLSIYFNAMVFKIFGSTLYVYRCITAMFAFCATISLYYVGRINFNRLESAIFALLSLLLLANPHSNLDFGRIQSFQVITFLALSLILFKENSKRLMLSGFLLGVASLIREPVLIVAVVMLLSYMVAGRNFNIPFPRLHLVAGFIAALSINAIILTAYSSWTEYLNDMLGGGTSFRYQNGFLSIQRISENLSHVEYLYNQFLIPIFLGALLAYFIDTNERSSVWVKFVVLPVVTFEALFINRTFEYSFYLLIPVLLWLTLWLIKKLSHDICNLKANFGEYNIRSLLLISCLMLAFPYLKNIYNIYKDYNKLAIQNISELKKLDPYRIVHFLNSVEHSTIAAYSQYPLIFLSNKNYEAKYPYLEDLSAAGNMGRPDLWDKSLFVIGSETRPDVIVDKTTGSFLSKGTTYGALLDKNYTNVAYFDLPKSSPAIMPYKHRLFVSNDFIETKYNKTQLNLDLSTGDFRPPPELSAPYMIQVVSTDPAGQCIKKVTMKVDDSQMSWRNEYTSNQSLTSLVPTGSSVIFEFDPSLKSECKKYIFPYLLVPKGANEK